MGGGAAAGAFGLLDGAARPHLNPPTNRSQTAIPRRAILWGLATDQTKDGELTPDTECVVVGGGPGGMMLAYLLARAGVAVTLLEGHAGFDRDFRGDSLHPYTLELLDQLGLADDLLELSHFKATRFRAHTPTTTVVLSDYWRLRSKFPYVALMPQVRFLDFMAERAGEFPTFTLLLGKRVRELIVEDGRVVGVRWRDGSAIEELRARLVVAADGRFSRLRTLSELPVEDLGASSDLLWFRLPRRASDPPEADVDLYFGRRNYVALLGGVDDWQLGYTLPKGGFAAARAAGVEPIRGFLQKHLPWLGERVDLLTGFDQTTLLSVELKRVTHWSRPGLLSEAHPLKSAARDSSSGPDVRLRRTGAATPSSGPTAPDHGASGVGRRPSSR